METASPLQQTDVIIPPLIIPLPSFLTMMNIMARVEQDDQQKPNFKHYCRVCKKGFMCGRALGGHMRAHGIGEDNGGFDEEDGSASDWEDKFGATNNNKRMYQLRTNPNRMKSCRNCENCGKEFLSWKSFLEHGKCSSDVASDSLVSSPDSDMEEDGRRRGGGGLSKRRRSLRSKVGSLSSNFNDLPISDEDDLLLARCLVQLANTTVEPALAEPEDSCTSASREEEWRNPSSYFRAAKGVSSSKGGGLFECKACNKVFTSHQALGGHRASHKKVKGCYAARLDHTQTRTDDDNNNMDGRITNDERTIILQSKPNSFSQFEQLAPLVAAARRKSKIHECSICHRVFTSGQALGGHKRCHWITSNTPLPDASSSLPKFLLQDNIEQQPIIQPKLNTDASSKLDLNVVPTLAAAGTSAIRRDPHNRLRFEVSTEMHLKRWMAPQRHSQPPLHLKNKEDNIINNDNNINNNNVRKNEMKGNTGNEDEADSEEKLTKLSDLNDLKEMTSNGNSSQWLQVGIGSAAADA